MTRRPGSFAAITACLLAMLMVASESAPLHAQDVTLSEIDYVTNDVDDSEFIEIANLTAGTLSLAGVHLVLRDGALDGTCEEYCRVDLSDLGSIAPGEHVVIGADPCASLPLCGAIDPIQDGSPDAVVLERDSVIIDSLEYASDLTNSVCALTMTWHVDVHGSLQFFSFGGDDGFWDISWPSPCFGNVIEAIESKPWDRVKSLYRD